MGTKGKARFFFGPSVWLTRRRLTKLLFWHSTKAFTRISSLYSWYRRNVCNTAGWGEQQAGGSLGGASSPACQPDCHAAPRRPKRTVPGEKEASVPHTCCCGRKDTRSEHETAWATTVSFSSPNASYVWWALPQTCWQMHPVHPVYTTTNWFATVPTAASSQWLSLLPHVPALRPDHSPRRPPSDPVSGSAPSPPHTPVTPPGRGTPTLTRTDKGACEWGLPPQLRLPQVRLPSKHGDWELRGPVPAS